MKRMIFSALSGMAMLVSGAQVQATTIVTIDFSPPPSPRPPLPNFDPPWLPKPPGAEPGLQVDPAAFDDNTSWFQIRNTTNRKWWDFHFRWKNVKEQIEIYEVGFPEEKGNCQKNTETCGVVFLQPGFAINESFIVKIPNLAPGDKLYVWGTIPEPASWAMMIAGFGLTGAVMRRRRMVAIVA